MITPIYAALLTPILVFLILRVVKLRKLHKIGLGDGDNMDLIRAVRAHGNFVETTPWVLILMTLLDIQGGNTYIMHFVGLALLIGRLCHLYAIHKGTVKLRTAGMMLTMTSMMVAGLYNFWIAVLVNVPIEP